MLIHFLIYVIFYKKVELHKYHKTTIFFKKFVTLYFSEDILKYPIVSALHLGPSFNSCFFPKESISLYESYGYFKQALYSYKIVNCFWQGNKFFGPKNTSILLCMVFSCILLIKIFKHTGHSWFKRVYYKVFIQHELSSENYLHLKEI